ncbi:MAG: hypothetical protein M1822_005558 [Bathelium mastoideum]|nr:MAG: hypothetical protein M1822_005558 [Bathelium mastoideum]
MAAGQPDVAALLAALTAQKQGSAQAQPQQPPLQPPPGFPGAMPTATPPAALGGLPLPQPSSSGSVDISAIKPSGSGQINFDDAIARARGFAQSKAREDPRLTGRPYRRSRSRSRSPPRRDRDSYRDSFNPYRDERRDDPRRGGNSYSRDRSNSPGPRGRAAYSPGPSRGYGRERSQPVRDHDTETVTVDSRMVGLIIGRNGENLTRVERETGARVQFVTGPEGSGPRRQCRISGSQRQRDEAKREIFQVIDDNGGNRASNSGAKGRDNQPALRDGENSIQILVPDRTVGLIIGRGGETIRDLQERSGCHVNIVGENKSINGMRPVNLIGNHQAASRARELIMEIVDSDTKSTNGGNPSMSSQRPQTRPNDIFFGGEQAAGGNDKINESIVVPSDAVGMIIGKGGETIKDMQNLTGCKINVSQPKPPDVEREIGLIGTRSAIENAKRAIWEKVDSVKDRPSRGGRGGRETDHYGGDYSQQQQQPQQPAYGSASATGAVSSNAPGTQGAGNNDPNAAGDPYAAWGGYQNYYAMWYAAVAQQQAQAQPGQLPQGQGGEQGPPGAS